MLLAIGTRGNIFVSVSRSTVNGQTVVTASQPPSERRTQANWRAGIHGGQSKSAANRELRWTEHWASHRPLNRNRSSPRRVGTTLAALPPSDSVMKFEA